MTARRNDPDRIRNDDLRDAFLASGISAADLARRLDFTRASGEADDGRVRNELGLKRQRSVKKGREYHYHRRTLHYALAARYARALGIDPIDLGL